MEKLAGHDVVLFFLALGLLLTVARLLGELAQRLGQAAVIGELLAGVLLGPTVLGYLWPVAERALFPTAGPGQVALDGLTTLAVVLFLLVAGMEVDLSSVWSQGKTAITVSLTGMIVPFALGFLLARFAPGVLGQPPETDRMLFALFFATALSISALPVIAKTLMDLYMYRSDLGMIVIAAAILNDLTGWIIFAIVLGLMGISGGHASASGDIMITIVSTLAFAAFMLTIGRWLIGKVLIQVQAHASWPGGVLGYALSLALFGAAFTEYIGVHAIFGSFLVGVAIGDSPHLRQRTRSVIAEFVSFIFAPLFFASVGLHVNFIAAFDWKLVLLVLVIACVGKIIGCFGGARFGGLGRRESWAVAFGMNARGTMEIILGLLALQYGVIGQPMFVSLLIMALVTSMISGPAMQRLLRRARPVRVIDFLLPKAFVHRLEASSAAGAIAELSAVLAGAADLSARAVEAAVLARERSMPTGLGNGVAVPHAQLYSLSGPIVAVGLSAGGIDFNARDDQPAHVVFLLLTPRGEPAMQIHLLADIARLFRDSKLSEEALTASSLTELLSLLKSSPAEVSHQPA